MPKLNPPQFVTAILSRLKSSGHTAYIVGGAVRNACLERPITDWDVTTSASRAEIETLFRDIPQFVLKHETVTLVGVGRHYEITPFRGKKQTIRDDLGHRDFTLNALAYDTEKAETLDYHNGREDISHRLIKATGQPTARFREDPLRLLRAVRLAVELDFTVETKTMDAMKDMASTLGSVSPERIRDELIKVLICPKPSKGLNLMRRTGLLEYIMPELLEGYLKRQNACHLYTIFRHIMETIDHVEPDPVLRLTALFHDIAKPRVRTKINGEWKFHGHERASAEMAEEIMRRLKFSKDMIQKTTNLVRYHMIVYGSDWTDGAVRRLIRRVGKNQIMSLLTFREADIVAHGLHCQKLDSLNELKERIIKIIKKPVITTPRNLAIDGQRIMQILGISSGPEVGIILKKLVEQVTDTPELNTKEKLVTLVRALKKE